MRRRYGWKIFKLAGTDFIWYPNQTGLSDDLLTVVQAEDYSSRFPSRPGMPIREVHGETAVLGGTSSGRVCSLVRPL